MIVRVSASSWSPVPVHSHLGLPLLQGTPLDIVSPLAKIGYATVPHSPEPAGLGMSGCQFCRDTKSQIIFNQRSMKRNSHFCN